MHVFDPLTGQIGKRREVRQCGNRWFAVSRHPATCLFESYSLIKLKCQEGFSQMPMPNEHSRREQEKRDNFTKLDNHNREMFKQTQDRFWQNSDRINKGSSPLKGGSNTSSHGMTTTSSSSGLGRVLKYIILGAIAL